MLYISNKEFKVNCDLCEFSFLELRRYRSFDGARSLLLLKIWFPQAKTDDLQTLLRNHRSPNDINVAHLEIGLLALASPSSQLERITDGRTHGDTVGKG